MKSEVLNKEGKEKAQINLPKNFSEEIREDILLKAFEVEKRKQPTGAFVLAGQQYSASGILRHRRHVWKTTYGRGISRIPRKIISRHGSSFNWIGATIASTRGGRRAHPPKVEENQSKKINKKELLIAFNSGLRGTIDNQYLEKKYNKKIDLKPIVFNSDILTLKTKEFLDVLKRIFGKYSDYILKKKKIRAGKGKTRGRRYKKNAGLLFVIASNEKMKRKGIDIVNVKDLKIKDLTPNGVPGRFTCYTEEAIKEIERRFK